jgi:hypothetical protein
LAVATPHLERSKQRRFSFRGLITYLAAISFLVMLTSGVVNFLAPNGRISRQLDWTLLGLDRPAWQTLHLSFAVVFVVVGVIHLAYNWKGLLHYLRDRASHHITLKWEAVTALLVSLLLVGSAVLALPPASTLHDFNAYFRQTYWTGEVPATEATPLFPTAPTVPLPQGHPSIPPDKICSDCHRGK